MRVSPPASSTASLLLGKQPLRGRLMSNAVKNHGVPKTVVDETFHQSHDFFALPLDTKRDVSHLTNAWARG